MARPRTFKESDVLAVARDCFWSAGYAGTSLDDLTAATGLRRSSLYGAFGDKHELYLRALDLYCGEQLDGLRQALGGCEPGSFGRLERHLEATAESCAEDARGCFLANALAERGARDPAVAQRARRAYGDWEELLAECVARAQREGEADASLDPGAAASLLLGAMRGMVSLGQAGKDSAFMRELAGLTLTALR